MESRSDPSRSEARLERLLRRIDAAIDEYSRARRSRPSRRDERPDEDAGRDGDLAWEAWWTLPLATRDWLLWYVPGWWALTPGLLRGFLLTTARLIVWSGLAPRVALRRAAVRLGLPPARRTTPRARAATRQAVRHFRTLSQRNRPATRRPVRATPSRPSRAAAWRAARTARTTPARTRSVAARQRRVPPRRMTGSRGVRIR